MGSVRGKKLYLRGDQLSSQPNGKIQAGSDEERGKDGQTGAVMAERTWRSAGWRGGSDGEAGQIHPQGKTLDPCKIKTTVGSDVGDGEGGLIQKIEIEEAGADLSVVVAMRVRVMVMKVSVGVILLANSPCSDSRHRAMVRTTEYRRTEGEEADPERSVSMAQGSHHLVKITRPWGLRQCKGRSRGGLAGEEGLEPSTSWTRTKRSTS